MSTTPYSNASKLNTAESLVVRDGHNARDSGAAAQDPADAKRIAHENEHDETPTLALDLSIRRGRLVLLTAVMVTAIMTVMVVFNRGMEVSRFDARDKSSTQQTKLLDDYNSYSGNISSAFGKPIEIFVAIAVQILVLRLMLKPEISWKVRAVTLALMTAIGYLISNGFNALNVQLRPLEIQPVISAADLAYETTGANATAEPTGKSSISWTKTVSENTPKNPLSNTILRQLVNARVQKSSPLCNWDLSNMFGRIPDTTMDFGFTQRDWQKRVLQEALKPTQLRLIANATDATINKNVKVSDLPMNASLAADIFIYGLLSVRWLFSSKEGTRNAFLPEMNHTNPTATSKHPAVGPTAMLAGLLPPTQQRASETEQRNWFLQKFPPILSRTLDDTYDLPFLSSNISTEFSHVDISESITFDSITFELEVNPELLGNATINGRKTQFAQTENCGPWPALCLVEKTQLFDPLSSLYDLPVQVGAFAACANGNGTEAIDTSYTGSSSEFLCPRRSNSSLLIVSVGKRLVADSIQQNAVFDVSATYEKTDSVVVTNLRKIFSVTVGRLSWQMQNLATDFNAECDIANCDGLHLPLAAADNQNNATAQASQQLVVGRDALPLSSLPALGNLYKFRPRMLSLIQINELARTERSFRYGPVAGDPLLLHNVKTVRWEKKVISNEDNVKPFADTNDTCNTFIEDRLYLTIKNHMYMEYSLQPAYTAATFFLFQNAVVKDLLRLQADRTSLNFEKNVQQIAVWASIPDQNAWLTLAGCIVLVASLGTVLLSSARNGGGDSRSLVGLTEPQTIARVMLDERHFPPMLLHRRVVGGDGAETTEPRSVDAFMIDGLSLQHHEDLESGNSKGPIARSCTHLTNTSY